MSISYDKGRSFERLVAKMIRSKLNIQVARDKRSGAGWNKSDISDWYSEIPVAIECKDHEKIDIKRWFRQARDSSHGVPPAVVFHADEEILVTLRFDDLLNFLVENKDLTNQLRELRSAGTCLAGHIADEHGYCEQKNCKYRRGYK